MTIYQLLELFLIDQTILITKTKNGLGLTRLQKKL